MAIRAPTPLHRPVPLAAVLATIQTLPRPVLARLTVSLIEQLDAIDGDADAEPDDEDACVAGDDPIASNAALGHEGDRIGDDDAEVGSVPEGISGGVVISDDQDEDDGPAIWRVHRDRIRAARCKPQVR